MVRLGALASCGELYRVSSESKDEGAPLHRTGALEADTFGLTSGGLSAFGGRPAFGAGMAHAMGDLLSGAAPRRTAGFTSPVLLRYSPDSTVPCSSAAVMAVGDGSEAFSSGGRAS